MVGLPEEATRGDVHGRLPWQVHARTWGRRAGPAEVCYTPTARNAPRAVTPKPRAPGLFSQTAAGVPGTAAGPAPRGPALLGSPPGPLLAEIVEGHLKEAGQDDHPLKRYGIDAALEQDRQVGDGQPGSLADLREGVVAALRCQPGGKQMLEQGRKLVQLCRVTLGLRAFTHGNIPSSSLPTRFVASHPLARRAVSIRRSPYHVDNARRGLPPRE